MSIPSSPTIASIVTEALKRGGRTTPSATQISDATEHQFREVKADISLKAALIPELLTQEMEIVVSGKSYYPWPVAVEQMQSIQLIESTTEGKWSGTAQSGGTSVITLDASFSAEEADMLGRYIFLVQGQGAYRFDQCTTYDNGTKVATVANAWTLAPTTGTRYYIEQNRYKLWERDKPVWLDTEHIAHVRNTPQHAVMFGREIRLFPVPDREYVLLYSYWAKLDELNDSGSVFLNHLRTYRSLWVQGIAVKCMQRYDEDRYMTEMGVYQDMLNAYAGISSGVGQVIYRDV